MTDKQRYIAACGVPPVIVAACNALGLYLPVRAVEENKLENLRPEGWIVSAAVFSAHLDYLIPKRRHVLVWVSEASRRQLPQQGVVSLYDSTEHWAEAFASLQQAGSPFGTETAAAHLSVREKEVLRLIAEGLTAKEIADKLGISANTVVTHRKNMSAKLGIRSVSGLSLYALMNGIL